MVRYLYERSFAYDAHAREMWPAIADTNLVQELTGPATYEAEDELQPDGSVLRRAHGTKMRPMANEWTEDLGEWTYARFCRQRRWFGEAGEQFLEYRVELEPDGDRTHVHFRVEINVDSALVWLGVKLGAISATINKVAKVQLSLIEAAIADANRPDDDRIDPLALLPYKPPALSDRAKARLPAIREELASLTSGSGLSDRLIDFLIRAPVDYLSRIRPLELAREWRADPDAVVDVFLAAHRARLLSLRWEVLCPRCRNDRDPAGSLEELPTQVHCSTCNIDYERDFSRNVELLFSPEGWLRELPDAVGCMLGAATTPHIVVQRHVEPGETLVIDPPLDPGTYNIRAPQRQGEFEIDISAGEAFPSIIAGPETLELGPAAEPGKIRMENKSDGKITVIIEERAWRRAALTGEKAITRAAFRRYCPEQILRPGDDVEIANVALMFTDLKGSTSLYEAIGDSAAYNLVRDHFDFLNKAVEFHSGTPVKTMGDAIIAAFSDGADALAAAVHLQEGVASFNDGREDGGIILKIGVHQGACIAVTADGKLDYFGSMVNLAARLQGQSQGGDIVVSTELWEAMDDDDRGVAIAFDCDEETASLRGFAAPVRYLRLTRTGVPADA